MRWLPTLLLPLLLQDGAGSVLIGTVNKDEDGWTFTIEGEEDVLRLRGVNPVGLKGKRAQLLAEREGDEVVAKVVDELHPPAKDLRVKIRAKGARAMLMEYFPQAGHRHPQRSCRVHAWKRAVFEARKGVIEAEVDVPAYAARAHVHIFVRVESPDEEAPAVDSDDWHHDGEVWKDKAMDEVGKSVEAVLEAP